MPDFPEYTIRQNTTRVLVPTLIYTTILGVVFYVGILLNVYLLKIPIPTNINILIIAVLAALVVIQCLLSYIQASKTQYLVYRNRIQIPGKEQYIMFNTIQQLKPVKNVFDKMFGTGTIFIDAKTNIKAVPNFDSTFAYLNQMLQYSRTQYSQI